MKTALLSLLLFFFMPLAPLQLHAKEKSKSAPPPSEFKTIHTYGGGPILEMTFNAIKMLIYGNSKEGIGKTFSGLIRVAMAIGALSVLVMAFGKGSFEPIFKNWFFPTLAVFAVLLIPRSDIYIKDHLTSKTGNTNLRSVTKVEDVPFFFASVASLTSWMSHILTKSLEDVAHGEKGIVYNWTGHIYAGETLFKAGQVKITDPTVEENIKNFCYHCVYNDLAINPPSYTRAQLKNSKDLLAFLQENTNPYLSFPYMDEGGVTSYVRCPKGMEHIRETIQKAKMVKPLSYLSRSTEAKEEAAVKGAIFANIGSDAQLLLSQSDQAKRSQKEFLEQQYMIDAIKMNRNPKYSTYRAKQIQKANQNILGDLAQSVIGMRNLFEGLIYFSFPLVIIFSLASFGLKSLFNWMQFLLWIMIWPPFFVIVNFFIHGYWKIGLLFKFGSTVAPSTIFTSSALSELYSVMEGAACVALFLVPFLSYAIMKGGVNQMVYLASSINASAQSGASIAAQEEASGNYSLGNVNYGSHSFSKSSAPMWDHNASLNQGKTTVGDGHTTISSDDSGNTILQKAQSVTGTDINLTETIGSRAQEAVNTAQSKVTSTENALNSSVTETLSSGESLYNAIDQNSNFGFMESQADQTQASNLWDQIQSDSQSYRELTGKSLNVKGGWDPGLFGKAFGVSAGVEATSSSSLENAQSAEIANRIGTNFQKLSQLVNTHSHGENLSEMQKISQDFSRNLNDSKTLSHQHRSALSEHETASTALENWENSQLEVREKLDNRFVDYLMEKYQDRSVVDKIYDDPNAIVREAQSFSEGYYDRVVRSTVSGFEVGSPEDLSSPRIEAAKNILGDQGKNIGKTIDQGQAALQEDLSSEQAKTYARFKQDLSFPHEEPPPEGYTGRTDQKEIVEKGSFDPKGPRFFSSPYGWVKDKAMASRARSLYENPALENVWQKDLVDEVKGSRHWEQYEQKINPSKQSKE